MEWRQIHSERGSSNLKTINLKNLYGIFYIIIFNNLMTLFSFIILARHFFLKISCTCQYCSASLLVYICHWCSQQTPDRVRICRVTNWLLMEIYVQWSDLQLTEAKTLLVTWDYEIILTNGGLVYNDLFPFLQNAANCGPHYLWVALKSRYRRMNVRLSVCVMGLIMVSCALHNEPHPHRKAISSTLPVWRAAHSSCFKVLSLQVAVWPV